MDALVVICKTYSIKPIFKYWQNQVAEAHLFIYEKGGGAPSYQAFDQSYDATTYRVLNFCSGLVFSKLPGAPHSGIS